VVTATPAHHQLPLARKRMGVGARKGWVCTGKQPYDGNPKYSTMSCTAFKQEHIPVACHMAATHIKEDKIMASKKSKARRALRRRSLTPARPMTRGSSDTVTTLSARVPRDMTCLS
jgi:hypothetical protein